MSIMLNSLLEKYGPYLTIPLTYTTREQAEHAHRMVQETCPELVVELGIERGEWHLVISKTTTARVPYDN